MTKILRSSTIIPPELYVHRDADRQLRSVLEEMGRPAYVLVARQMGKTNLLLNARRELQGPSDAFVYIDLSNSFSSARECFRNIIDTALESHRTSFESVVEKISAIRQREFPPHKEHDLELRELLRVIGGKLVIILDEIDALTTSNFSDQIFAQIRSTYFSRANFPDYTRLTYVLSGVAEPIELIRNPKLSPFNIGEKIYLDDFTQTEFQQFLQKSRLVLSTDATNRIFEWASGNPRISWDICAEIEDTLLSGREVTPLTVDQVISKLYLTSFDRAPIDHIRILAETTPEIRSALIELRYGKGSFLSDNIRSKLYLAGIISSNGDAPRIKNNIIDLSLSDQWLHDVERRKLGLLKLADEQLARENYRAAIDTLTDYLTKGTPSEQERITAIDGLSRAHYSLGEYQKALEWLENGRFDKSRMAELYFSQTYRKGICYFQINDYTKSIECLNEVIKWEQDNNRDKKRYYESIANLASAYYYSDFEKHKNEIIKLYRQVIDETENTNTASFTTGQTQALKLGARYNLANTYQRLDLHDLAIKELELALEEASLIERPVFLYELLTSVSDPERKRALLRTSVEIILQEKLKPSTLPRSDKPVRLTPSIIGGLLSAAFEIDEADTFNRLFDYCFNGDSAFDPASITAILQELLPSLVSSLDRAASGRLADRLVSIASSIGDESTVFLCTRALAGSTLGHKDFLPHASRYLALLDKQPKTRPLDRLDTRIIVAAINSSVDKKHLREAKRILDIADKYRSSTPIGLYILLDYYSMIIAVLVGDREIAKACAIGVIDTLDDPQTKPQLRQDDVVNMRREAQFIISNSSRSAAIPSLNRKYHRNQIVTVRYTDGRIVTAKYKKLEDDIRAGHCTVFAPKDS